MSDLPAYLADAWLSLAAGLGALIVLRSLGALTPDDGLRWRMRLLLILLVTLMVARIGHFAGAGWLFSALTHGSAALLPLAALLLAEGLLRRHAPRWLKAFCAGGGAFLCLVGLIQLEAVEPLRIGGLLALQLIGLLAVAQFVARRDRNSLAADENAMINRMALAFLLVLPLLATDFMRGDGGDIPVRMGGLAVLALCWLAISLGRTGLGTRQIVFGFAVSLAMSAVLSLLIAGFTPLEWRSAVQTSASILAGILLLAIAQAAIALRIEDQHNLALRHIAQARAEGTDAALSFVRQAAGSPEALRLGDSDLSGLDREALERVMQAQPMQDHSSADEGIRWVLDRVGASHLLMTGSAPLRLIALDRPAIARTDRSGAGLGAIQRVAAWLERGDA